MCWTEISFMEGDKCIGEMNVDIDDDSAFIFFISSSKKGTGTKMLEYLRDHYDIKTITGDADPDSIGFSNKFNP